MRCRPRSSNGRSGELRRIDPRAGHGRDSSEGCAGRGAGDDSRRHRTTKRPATRASRRRRRRAGGGCPACRRDPRSRATRTRARGRRRAKESSKRRRQGPSREAPAHVLTCSIGDSAASGHLPVRSSRWNAMFNNMTRSKLLQIWFTCCGADRRRRLRAWRKHDDQHGSHPAGPVPGSAGNHHEAVAERSAADDRSSASRHRRSEIPAMSERVHMTRPRTLAICAVGLVLATHGVAGQSLAQYRNFELGSTLASVAGLIGVPQSQAKTIHTASRRAAGSGMAALAMDPGIRSPFDGSGRADRLQLLRRPPVPDRR